MRVESRVTEFAGFAIAALFVVSVFLAESSLLDPGHSPETLAAAYALHHRLVLATGWLAALTWGLAFPVFAGGLSAALAERSPAHPTWAWVGLAGAVAESLAILIVVLCSQTAAYTAGRVEPATILALHQGALLANALSGFPTIVCVVAYALGLHRTGPLPISLLGLTALCVVAHLASTLSLAPGGFAAPSGPAGLVAPFTMAGWVLGASVVLRSRRSRQP